MAETDPSPMTGTTAEAAAGASDLVAEAALAADNTGPQICLNWKNSSKTGWTGGFNSGGTTLNPALIHWFTQSRGGLDTEDKHAPPAPTQSTTDTIAFSSKYLQGPETLHIDFEYRHSFFETFFGVRIVIEQTKGIFWEVNSSHDPKWYRPGNTWTVKYSNAPKWVGRHFLCTTNQLTSGPGSILNLNITIGDRSPNAPGPDD